MLTSAFIGRTVFASALLLYGAWSDFTKREVENWVPMALVLGGVIFSAWDAVTSGSFLPVILAVASGAVGFAIALAIFYAGAMGGADCKIFIGISTMFPLVISSPLPLLSQVNPLVDGSQRLLPMFSLSWLVNSLLVSLVVPVVLFLKNLASWVRGEAGDLGWNVLPALFVGYRTEVRNLRASFLIPLERFEEREGETVRILRYAKGVLEEEEERELIAKVRENLGDDEEIWAFPYVPFIIPMLVAFFLTLTTGDLLVNLMMSF